jgi:hypothetical protein
LRYGNDAQDERREKQGCIESDCQKGQKHESHSDAKAHPSSNDSSLLYVGLQFRHFITLAETWFRASSRRRWFSLF